MKQSSNQARKIRYSFFIDPLNPIAVACLVMLCAAGFLDYGGIVYIVMVVVSAVAGTLYYTRQNDHPRLFSKRLSKYFFSFKLFYGRWLIVQRKNKRQKDLDCRKLLRDLTEDAKRLTDALRNLPGRYRTITHDTVIDRLKAMEEAEITMEETAYKATLEGTVSALTGKSCKRCKKKCPFPNRQLKRQFFDVEFEIK